MNGFEIFPILSFAVIIILISGRVWFLKRKGITVSSGSSKRKKSLLLLYPIFFLILMLWLFEIIRSTFHISFSFLPEIVNNLLIELLFLKIAGVSLIAFSLVLLAVALHNFNNSLRFGTNEKNKGELITTGIFSLSRNPFFLSIDLYFLGIPMLLPSFFFIGFTALAIISIHLFILKEEKFMVDVYSEEYEKYALKVRRYF